MSPCVTFFFCLFVYVSIVNKMLSILFYRQEFVELYIDFILNKSVETQFNAFYAGFMKVCGGPVMELFRSHELMGLIIGNENYDWDAFEQSAKYKGGYTSGDPTVHFFFSFN